MCNHTAVAKHFVTAACALAIALFTIDMIVSPTWAGSDQTPGMKITSRLFEGVYRTSTKAAKATRFTQMCVQYHEECTSYPDMRFPCCDPNQTCDTNPNANGRYWCTTPVRGACMHLDEECSWPPAESSRCCAGDQVCRPNPNSNGGYWCVGDVK
jgi:hypothetical protein